MDNVYEVLMTTHAETALRELAHYITYELLSPQTAVSYINILLESIKKLDRFPNRISLIDEEPWRSYGIHQMIVKNHYVYFWIDEENLKVQITDIIFARKNQREALERMPIIDN